MPSWQSHVLHRVLDRRLRGSPETQRRRSARPVPEHLTPEMAQRLRSNLEELTRVGKRLQPAVDQGTLGSVPAEHYRPRGAQDRHLLYLHGGGYTMGSPATHRNLSCRLAKAARAHCWSVDYRLSPEHPHPAGLDDAFSAWMALIGRHDPSRCVLAGDSAGGGLACALLDRLVRRDLPLPSAVYLMSPWTDLSLSGASIQHNRTNDPMVPPRYLPLLVDAYRGPLEPTHPSVSPLFAPMEGWPPILVHAGDREVLPDDSVRLAERARRAGVHVELEVWPGQTHVFPAFAPLLPEGRRALREGGAFLRRQTAR